MTPITATLTLTKSTKGTHVYSEALTQPAAVFPTIYVQKSALPKPPPATIVVTITEGK